MISEPADQPSRCALCSGIARPLAPWDQPLLESQNFVAIPSLGSLLEGWLLITPRRHFISTGALPESLGAELSAFRCEVSAHLEMIYGDICAFEHGPFAPNRQAGCGVDHAHVHLVPLSFDLVEIARPLMPSDTTWTRAFWSDCKSAFDRRLDYLFVEQPVGEGRIAVADRFGSQILRRAIATAIGNADSFDWREHPNHNNIDRTIRSVSAASRAELAV